MAGLAVVIAQAALLFVLSRHLLLGYVLQALASRLTSRRGRRLIALIRLPGNFLHEASHAAAYLASGYTIRRFATCFTDPEERGYVETGSPWSPLHWSPLSAALSCAAPILVGALALRTLGLALGIHVPQADVASEHPSLTQTLSDLYTFLRRLDWSAWQTYVFWLLALSIGADLAPSGTDLRQGVGTLVAMVALFGLAVYALPHTELRGETARSIYAGLSWLLSTLSTALFAGLVSVGVVAAVAGAMTWLLRRA